MGRARDIRLIGDYNKIIQLANQCPYFRVRPIKGQPPTNYLLEFSLTGYIDADGHTSSMHKVRLTFPEKYPFSAPPKFSFLNGLFHPNVYRNGEVCHGWYLNNWNPSIHIDDLILDIAKMICFKQNSYNLSSPANYSCDRDWIATHAIPADYTNLEACLSTPTPNNEAPSANTTSSLRPVNPVKIKFHSPQSSPSNNHQKGTMHNSPFKMRIIKKK